MWCSTPHLPVHEHRARAARLGVVFRDTELHVRGLQHLPGLPGTAKTCAGGTTCRIPTDCPGIPSITIHNSHTPADEQS